MEYEKFVEYGEVTHPRQIGPDAPIHKSQLVLWFVQQKHGEWVYNRELHPLPPEGGLDLHNPSSMFPRGLDRLKKYVTAYDFGPYFWVYGAMKDVEGMTVLSFEEAESLISSGKVG